MDPYTGVLFGVVSGIGWGLISYGREKQKDESGKLSFSWKYFLKTVVIGAIVGAYAGYMGAPIETIVATPIVDKIANIIGGIFK